MAIDGYHRWMEVVVPASLTRLPSHSVPVEFGVDDTPMGTPLIGHRGAEATVLALGRDYEAASDWVYQQLM